MFRLRAVRRLQPLHRFTIALYYYFGLTNIQIPLLCRSSDFIWGRIEKIVSHGQPVCLPVRTGQEFLWLVGSPDQSPSVRSANLGGYAIWPPEMILKMYPSMDVLRTKCVLYNLGIHLTIGKEHIVIVLRCTIYILRIYRWNITHLIFSLSPHFSQTLLDSC